MRVLLSIRPPHVENILSGRKTFEFRRKIFARPDVQTVLIYCTKPVGRLVAEFEIAAIHSSHPQKLWRSTRKGSGISKAYYDSYFAGRERAYAIEIGKLTVFEQPIDPAEWFEDFIAPQSYMYLFQTSARLSFARTQ